MTKRIMVGLVALMCVALVLGAMGCGDGGGSGDGSPEQVVKDFWSAFKKGDFEKAKTFLSEEIADTALEDMSYQDDPLTAAMVDAVMDLMDLEVTGSSIDGDSAAVEVELTMPDMDAVGEELTAALFAGMGEDAANLTEDQIMEEFARILPDIMKDAPVTTENSEIPMVKEGGDWKIEASPFEDLEGGF